MTQLWAWVPLTGNVELLAGENVRGRDAASEVGGAAGAESTVGTLRAAKSELEDGIALGGFADARCLGGDEGLEVDDVEEGGFDELALQNGSAHLQDGEVGEGEAAFGKGFDGEAPVEFGEGVEVAFLKEGFPVVAGESGEVGEVFFGEVEVAEVVEGGLDAGDEGGGFAEGSAAEEEMEDRFLLVAVVVPVGLAHGELVEVGEERAVGHGNDNRCIFYTNKGFLDLF